MHYNKNDILGVILAGGSSRRMGKTDKFFLEHQGKSLLQRAIERAYPQTQRLIISANGDLERFKSYQIKVISDGVNQQCGPLAGVISAMDWAQENAPSYKWLMTFASDTPKFPLECTSKLKDLAEREGYQAVVCRTGTQVHYTFCLWALDMREHLHNMISQGQRALYWNIEQLNYGIVDFEDSNSAFFNVNTPDDWIKFNQLDHNDP